MKAYQSVWNIAIFLVFGIAAVVLSALLWDNLPLGAQILIPLAGMLFLLSGLRGILFRKPIFEADNFGFILYSHSKHRISWQSILKIKRFAFTQTNKGRPIAVERFKALDSIRVTYRLPRESQHPSDHPSVRHKIRHCDIHFSTINISPDDFLAFATPHTEAQIQAQQGAAANP